MTLPYALATDRPTQIGLIVLQTDETIERDMRLLMPDDVEILVSRVPSAQTVTSETLQAMEQELTRAASLLPGGASLAAVGYGCTSGTAQIGPDNVTAKVQAGIATPVVTQPLSALIAACQHLGVTRIGMISPYVAAVSERLRMALADAGVNVADFASFDEPQEEKVVRIAADSVSDAAIAMGQNPQCEAVFLSCTNLRTLDVISRIESQIAKPVLSSNQVLAWHLCQLAQLRTQGAPVGALFA
ncbi:maleate cis-trans isomerase family protein [Yoonia sediminilitoris]|uniref:Maleate isomerase n=1 Tax=Yoonia sediminilitoris TaxID=1286148 RepID=A0A2T6KAI5_9RHOB|nr:aspartate/glutamate racemase family protein [Yoonia sediminilitoris]PUB11843.1 maleate isomerase [Yoonia sediminilitoris]RCW91920.1 maleate isomerase [Yoonia sediminilitoris]